MIAAVGAVDADNFRHNVATKQVPKIIMVNGSWLNTGGRSTAL